MDRYRKILKEKAKQISVDSVEMKESVHALTKEAVSSKFAVIYEDSHSLNVSFYGIKTEKNPVLLKNMGENPVMLKRKTANHLFWSPTGQFIILEGNNYFAFDND